MKVWVVESSYDFGGWSLEAVFSTKELADEYCTERRITSSHLDFSVTEFTVDEPYGE